MVETLRSDAGRVLWAELVAPAAVVFIFGQLGLATVEAGTVAIAPTILAFPNATFSLTAPWNRVWQRLANVLALSAMIHVGVDVDAFGWAALG